MTIQLLGKNALALCLTAADLEPYRLSPADPDPVRTLYMLREVGISLPYRARIEAYPQPDALLLFVQAPRRPRHYNSIT